MTLAILNTLTIASTQKKFEDFGKKMSKQRKSHLNSIGEQLKKIADEERKRAKHIFDEHKSFFSDKIETSTSTTSIDFYEK